MNWILPFHSKSGEVLADSGLPRRLLRHLFEGRDVGIGTRILDVGCGCGELLRFLDQLGLDAAGLEQSLDNVYACRRISPQLVCLCGTPEDPLPFPAHQFDLVLARNLSVHDADLLGTRALCSTARLLAAVRPGGSLCIVRRKPPIATAETGIPSDHHADCFRLHLETFGIDVGLSHVGDTWNWLSRFVPKSRYLTAILRVPPHARTLNEWLRIALRAANRRTIACCSNVAGENLAPALRYRAA